MRYSIYVVAPQEGFPCKIGYASSLRKRLKTLQASHWDTLFIHDAVLVKSKRTAMRLEKLCHKRLASDCIRGEWFNCFAEDAGKMLREVSLEMNEALNNKGNSETRWATNYAKIKSVVA